MLDAALSQAWPPFVLVAALLVIGAVAHDDGMFRQLGQALERLPGSALVLLLVSCALTAVVSAILNLDTAVVFVTPVIVVAARNRGLTPTPFLYAALLMSNAASLYLPGSNLTNLLVLHGSHGGSLLSTMWKPALAATLITGGGLALAFRRPLGRVAVRPVSHGSLSRTPGLTGPIAATAAAVAMVCFTHPALPVLGVATLAGGAALMRHRIAPRALVTATSPHVLAAIFAVAIGLGVLARAWDGPAQFLAHADAAETAAVAAVTSVLINNLPAAVLLSARTPPHPEALLIGLNLGPNLAVTGSLAAFLWFATARQLQLTPRALTVSKLGIVLAPLSMAAGVALLPR